MSQRLKIQIEATDKSAQSLGTASVAVFVISFIGGLIAIISGFSDSDVILTSLGAGVIIQGWLVRSFLSAFVEKLNLDVAMALESDSATE